MSVAYTVADQTRIQIAAVLFQRIRDCGEGGITPKQKEELIAFLRNESIRTVVKSSGPPHHAVSLDGFKCDICGAFYKGYDLHPFIHVHGCPIEGR